MKDAGYCMVNAVIEQHNTAEALTNLANATLEDRNAVANLTEANLNLTKNLNEKDEEIKRLKETLKNMRIESNNLKKGKCKSYCWTHGMNWNHNSKNFWNKANGHKDEANVKDTMGGN